MTELKTLGDYLIVCGVRDRTFVHKDSASFYNINSIFEENSRVLISVDYSNSGGGSSLFYLSERLEDLERSVFEAENET